MPMFVVYKVWTYSDIDSLGGLRRHGAHFVQGLVAEWGDMKKVGQIALEIIIDQGEETHVCHITIHDQTRCYVFCFAPGPHP